MSDSASIMPAHPPVTDWVNDFDHTDPRWTEDPFPIWEELRAECPVVHTKRFLGCLPADHLSGGEGNRLRHRAFFLPPRHRT